MQGMVKLERFGLAFPLERLIDYEDVKENGQSKVKIRIQTGNDPNAFTAWTLNARSIDVLDEALAKALSPDAERVQKLENENSKLREQVQNLRYQTFNRDRLIEARDYLIALKLSPYWEKLHNVVKQRIGKAAAKLYWAIYR